MSPNMNKSEYMPFSSPIIATVSGADTAVTTSEGIGLPPKAPFSTSSHSIRSSRYETRDSTKPCRPTISGRNHRDRLWLNLDRPIQETRFVGKFRSHIILISLIFPIFQTNPSYFLSFPILPWFPQFLFPVFTPSELVLL